MTEQFPGAVLDTLDAAGDRPVFEHAGREVSGDRLLGMVRRAVNGLRQRGAGPGDGVAMLLGADPGAFAAIIAAHVVGARVVGVRPGLTASQRDHLLRGAEVTVADRSDGSGNTRNGPVLALDDLLASADDGVRPRVLARPGDVARLLHTSGSTGLPKACAQTYAAMTASWVHRPDTWPPAVRELAGRLDRFLVFGTLASQVMMEYGLLTLAAGGTLVTADPSNFPDALVRHRATASVVTAARLTKLLAAQRESPVDLGGLRALMVSGSPLEPGRLREAAAVLGPVVFHGYGQTETGMISMATPEEPAGSLGVPPVELEVRDPSGRPVPHGTDGELFVRTPSQSSGYWQEPALTAEVFRDGWVRTRDLGRLDASGRLWLTGRIRDVIIVNANVHYAGPVERLLAAHPSVAEAYVVAVPDDSTGEAVHAFVVPEAGHTPELAELRALVTTGLGEACAPTRLTLIEEVPLTAAGKPDKRSLAGGG
ncbi:class I adenylate-forming enzyme family protein [Streptomyces sp. HB132]|uniref:class I adenylate-forming enzyme family protein n=1 Tax=Streptomyces sp. HB132 TaxID=767388 RepID=UPI00195FA1E5|nr:fatty acid--CoA ligase family protein [Streptomyces sp. HB132]MBM7442392.1 acyl-coenzyme A synthetase/AMP-(fatty) acid ligase [Streptomyces sp. HB132]